MDVENETASNGEKDRQSVITVESYLDVRGKDKVKRRLRQRHVQMYAANFFSFSTCSSRHSDRIAVRGQWF